MWDESSGFCLQDWGVLVNHHGLVRGSRCVDQNLLFLFEEKKKKKRKKKKVRSGLFPSSGKRRRKRGAVIFDLDSIREHVQHNGEPLGVL